MQNKKSKKEEYNPFTFYFTDNSKWVNGRLIESDENNEKDENNERDENEKSSVDKIVEPEATAEPISIEDEFDLEPDPMSKPLKFVISITILGLILVPWIYFALMSEMATNLYDNHFLLYLLLIWGIPGLFFIAIMSFLSTWVQYTPLDKRNNNLKTYIKIFKGESSFGLIVVALILLWLVVGIGLIALPHCITVRQPLSGLMQFAGVVILGYPFKDIIMKL